MQAILSELAEIAGARFEGDGDCIIRSVNTLSDAGQGDISFLTNERYKAELQKTKAEAVILDEPFISDCPVENKIISDNPYLCYALIAQYLSDDKHRVSPGVHETAVISESVSIAPTAAIGPLVVLGDNVIIHEGVSIGAGTTIGDNCIIGQDSVLTARVTLYANTRIGKRCLIHSGAVVGGDGFGFANDKGRWVKIPQTGRVVIGDDVEIGVNTAIDCGAINDTVIEDGVKLDNQIQIAHNVRLGRNTAIAGGTGIAGSTTIGEGCTIGGNSGIVGHVNIADNIHVSAMTIVSRSLSEPGQYTGNVPAMPHKVWAKNMVRLKQLDELSKRIKNLEKKLEEQE